MPYFYEILGSKVIEHSGKNVVVFFILVKAYATSSNPLRKGEGLTEETWIVAKSQVSTFITFFLLLFILVYQLNFYNNFYCFYIALFYETC